MLGITPDELRRLVDNADAKSCRGSKVRIGHEPDEDGVAFGWEVEAGSEEVAQEIMIAFVLAQDRAWRIEELEDENARLRRPWLPIETAPKDGSEIILATQSGDVLVACWTDVRQRWHHRSDLDDRPHEDDPAVKWQPMPKP